MDDLLSILTAVLISAMIVVNGELTAFYGLFAATVIIHVVGLLTTTCMVMVKREPVFSFRRLPLSFYLGGAIGVATTMFNNMAFNRISVSSIVALGLVGQSVTSLIIDQFGFFNLPARRFCKEKTAGLLFAAAGTGFMLTGSKFSPVPVLLAFLTGVSVVTSRCVNAQLSEKTSVLTSTWYNFVVGLLLSALLMGGAAGTGRLAAFRTSFSPAVWIYLGGMIGVCVVSLLNILTPRLPAFHMTLILFAGQVFTGFVLDALLTHSFSEANLIGGIFVTAGLVLNAWLDGRNAGRAKAPAVYAVRETRDEKSKVLDSAKKEK